MEKIVNCPICHKTSKSLRPFAKRGAESLELYRCKSCEQEFLHPFPSDEWLTEEYSQYFQKRQSGTSGNKTDYFYDLFKSLALNFNDRSVLEFGPGEGDSIQALMKLGKPSQITLVERNDEANSLLSKYNCAHHNMFLEEYLSTNPDNKKFDYIFLFDVLEHLKNPVEVLKKIKEEKLNSGGFIVTTFPVADSFSRKILGNLWPQFKVEHLQYFSKKSIDEMAKASGLSINQNEVLFKKLSAGYLLNVGKGFGPDKFKALVQKVDKVPGPWKKLNLTLGYGERLVLFAN